jgi:HK97 family phage major capsid protein
MKKSTELKLERTAKLQSQQALVAKAKEEKREMTDEENASFDTLQTESEALTRSIQRSEQLEKNELLLGTREENRADDAPDAEETPKAVFSIHRAIRSQMANGKLEGVEKEVHDRIMASEKPGNITLSGVAIPMNRAHQSVAGDTGTKGGALVATDLQSPIDFLRPEPLMKKIGATYITGLTGNLRFPKNEGGIVASWEGETATTPETANVYGYLDSIPKRLSVTVPISLQNLMQSSIDLERYTVNEINLAIENAIDAAAVNGTGTGQPLGILNNTNVNVVTTATDGSAPSWDMIVDAETNVFVANASSAKMNYLVNPKTRGKLKKTKHSAGDLNYIMGVDGNVNGYASAVSNHVPSNLVKGSGTGLSALVFGDFSQLNIHQWGFMDLSVDEFSRKKEGLIEVTVNIFLDVLVKQPKAFSVAKGLITV